MRIPQFEREGRAAPHSKFSAQDIKAIRDGYDSGRKVMDLAREFRVSPQTIRNIGRRISFLHITEDGQEIRNDLAPARSPEDFERELMRDLQGQQQG